MKKFLVMAMIALVAFFASCNGLSGGGLDNAPVCDDQAGTINGVAYDKETPKCWKIESWQKADGSDEDDYKDQSWVNYEWDTEYAIRKSKEYWKASVNVTYDQTIYGVRIWYRSSGDFTMTEVADRTDDTCYESYGQ